MEGFKRTRRLRSNQRIRDMVAETSLSVSDLIYPLFVVEGQGIKEEISSMSDQYRYSIDELLKEADKLSDLGIYNLLLFGIPEKKDACGSQGFAENGIVQKAVRALKENFPDFYIITDVCMCEYTDHGHCGILDEKGRVKNDETLEYLGKIALSHVQAGADMIAPSDMMDGRIAYIRHILDQAGSTNIPIMSYSSKYSSKYYGPFREAAESAPSFGDRQSYQMDSRNSNEALVEMEADVLEGADILMVKPALSYLDIIYRAKENFDLPICTYNVSGEYSMIVNAIENGLVDEEIIEETLLSMKRAGADIIITYFAKYMAKKVNKREK